MISIGLALKLRPGCYAEYKRRHDELWPELAEVLRTNAVSMVIYPFGDYLFVHETAPSDEAFDRVNRHPENARWNKYMSEVLETDGSGNPIHQRLPLAFAFGNFV